MFEMVGMNVIALFSLFLLFVRVVTQDNPDKITSLPGQPNDIPFDIYGGYVTVNAKNQRKLYYFLAEAQKTAETKPLILWQTGGPGWSSLYAMLLENGPFTPTPEGKALLSVGWAWNNLANMLFVESPAGVGFSTSNNANDYTVGDDRTASDLVVFLAGFLGKYPKYVNRKFYLAGESYAGHYIPHLALKLTKANLSLDFKGFLVGNPWTYPKFDNNGTALFWFTHGLMSVEDFSTINRVCNFSQSGPFLIYPKTFSMNTLCLETITKVRKVLENINPYDIYEDLCTRISKTETDISSWERKIDQLRDNPCGELDLNLYLNRADVQKAMHADPMEWSMRSKVLHYSVHDLMTSMKQIWEELLLHHSNLKFLVYSGDVDAAVPWLGTILWIKDLEKDGTIKLVKDWSPWFVKDWGPFYPTSQVGGFTLEYDKLTFKTVRDAGHQVPSYQPRRGYEMLDNFLNPE